MKLTLKSPDDVEFSKLIKQFKKGSIIGLYSDDSINLITNNHFMVNVSEEMLWRVQCKFELRWNNGKYCIGGDNRKQTEWPKMLDLYKTITESTELKPLQVTNLQFTCDNYTCEILAGNSGYVAVAANYTGLFGGLLDGDNIKGTTPESPIVIFDRHIITPVRTGGYKWLKEIQHEKAV